MLRLVRRVTPAGRAVLGVSLLAFVASRWAGLVELAVLAAMGLLMMAVALTLVLLPANVQCRLTLRPAVTVVGRPVTAEVQLEHRSGAPLLLPSIEIGIGDERSRHAIPWLRRRGRITRKIPVTSTRRGVLLLGPVVLQREDPLGLVRWSTQVHEAVTLYIRPLTTPVESVGIGSIRDLEGVPNSEISMSDLAFHALREYVPGDDLRHVHWRSSAKADQLLVRQYHDSRRSRATIVLDTSATSYGSDEEFELAVSVAASLAVRAVADDQDVTFVCGEEELAGRTASDVLDACCRVAPDEISPSEAGVRAAGLAPETSVVLVATGSRTGFADLRMLGSAFGPSVRVLAFRARPGGTVGLSISENVHLIDLVELSSLGFVMSEIAVMPT